MGELMETADTSRVPQYVEAMTACERQQPNQLYDIFLLMCSQQPLTEVVNSGDGEGAVAWRRTGGCLRSCIEVKSLRDSCWAFELELRETSK